MCQEFRWDVFVSHSSTDTQRVERLVSRLLDAGLTVWFDREQIASGDDFVGAIEQGLNQSRVLLLCLTPAIALSQWSRLEYSAAISRDPDNDERRLIPVLMEDCEVPAVLRRLNHVDMRQESEEAWSTLLAALNQRAPTSTVHTSQLDNPFNPYSPAVGSYFVGRRAELRYLMQAAECGYSVSVVGIWRIGKTSLLDAFAAKAQAAGRVVKQLSGEGPEGASIGAFTSCIIDAQGSNDPDIAADQLSRWATTGQNKLLPPILVIDESEYLIKTYDPHFFERLRGMMGRAILVFSSRCDLDLVHHRIGRTSPFHNQVQLIHIGLIESSAVEEIISWGKAILRHSDESIIREWAGRHPYFVQVVAHEIANARLSGTDLDAALDRCNLTAAMRFRETWSVLDDRDRDELKRTMTGPASPRLSLRANGLIEADGKPFGRLLTEWLKDACS